MEDTKAQAASLKASIEQLQVEHDQAMSAMIASYRRLTDNPSDPEVVSEHQKAVCTEISIRESIDDAKSLWSGMLARLATQAA